MPNVCAVECCETKQIRGCGVRFHKLPTKQPVRSLWLRALRRRDGNRTVLVCSRHFPSHSYERNLSVLQEIGLSLRNARLREDAVPTLYLHEHDARPAENSKLNGEALDLNNLSIPEWDPAPPSRPRKRTCHKHAVPGKLVESKEKAEPTPRMASVGIQTQQQRRSTSTQCALGFFKNCATQTGILPAASTSRLTVVQQSLLRGALVNPHPNVQLPAALPGVKSTKEARTHDDADIDVREQNTENDKGPFHPTNSERDTDENGEEATPLQKTCIVFPKQLLDLSKTRYPEANGEG
ncbi:uncharacterized protein LOC135395287 isoform X2 [Ornithodoros turicata]|uniref:uncharacterized protein LOC135395287 isoform X2 n=1 Tax=Ornithodoros turicata TaxID=34597 RepID=UPI003139B740